MPPAATSARRALASFCSKWSCGLSLRQWRVQDYNRCGTNLAAATVDRSVGTSRLLRTLRNAHATLQYRRLADHHFGSDRHALVEIDDVGIDQPEAARRHRRPDRLRRIGPVQPVDRGAEIEGARAHRIAGTTGHEARQIGLALDHLGRRGPIRPFLFARDVDEAGPLEAIAPDPDAVTHGAAVALHQIE